MYQCSEGTQNSTIAAAAMQQDDLQRSALDIEPIQVDLRVLPLPPLLFRVARELHDVRQERSIRPQILASRVAVGLCHLPILYP